MKNTFVKLALLFTLGAASSAFADVTLRYDSGQLGILYRDGALVVYKLCAPGTSVATRSCAAPQIEKSMVFVTYVTSLQKNFGASDEIFHGVDALQRIRVEIAFVERRTVDASLSPDEMARTQARLLELVDLELKLVKADAVLKFLELGRDITYAASTSDFFNLITMALGDVDSPRTLRHAYKDSNNGVIWVGLGWMCWWDAAGLRRESQCEGEGPPSRGCKLGLGSAWDLPSSDQVESRERTSDFFESDQGCFWVRDLPGAPFRTCRVSYLNRYGGTSYTNANSESRLPTYCTAPASVVDPTGDIDGDGVNNREDHCNQVPQDLTAPIHRDEPYKGCAGGQIPNN